MTTHIPVEELMHEHEHILKVVSASKVLGQQVKRNNARRLLVMDALIKIKAERCL